MAKLLIVHVKESLQELKLLQKSTPKCSKRIQMLILIKEGTITSKDALAFELGVSNKSVHVWRTKYQVGGALYLLKENRGGNKIGKITPEIHKKLSDRFYSKTGFKDRAEIQSWLKDKFGIEMKYYTVCKYIRRKFGASRHVWNSRWKK